MSKNISINFKFNGMKNEGMLKFLDLGKRATELFLFITARTDGDKYISGDYADQAMKSLGISESTYWRQLGVIEKSGLIVKYSKGRYIVNPKFLEIFTKLDAVLYNEFKKSNKTV